MKKIFWTSIFWIALVVAFGLYLRIVGWNLADKVANVFANQNISGVITQSTQQTGILDEIAIISQQIDIVEEKMNQIPVTTTPSTDLSCVSGTAVKLYYFNQIQDQKLSPEQQININSILPITRNLSASQNIIKDTINLLLEWNLADEDIKQWFITEFPNKYFHLVDSQLAEDGTLTLQFNEVPGFTDGWSARMLMLSNSIIKTAEQFPGVKSVKVIPETLFQP